MVPEDARARILLAADYGSQGKKEAAVEQVASAVAMRPNDSNTLYNAACTYGLMTMKVEALAMLKRAVEAGHLNLAWVSRDWPFHSGPGHVHCCASTSCAMVAYGFRPSGAWRSEIHFPEAAKTRPSSISLARSVCQSTAPAIAAVASPP